MTLDGSRPVHQKLLLADPQPAQKKCAGCGIYAIGPLALLWLPDGLDVQETYPALPLSEPRRRG